MTKHKIDPKGNTMMSLLPTGMEKRRNDLYLKGKLTKIISTSGTPKIERQRQDKLRDDDDVSSMTFKKYNEKFGVIESNRIEQKNFNK